MHSLTFNNTENKSCQNDGTYYATDARYQIDWRNGERKFKEPIHGIRVFEGGMITISSNTYRQPGLWNQYKHRFDVEIHPARDWTGFNFFTPDGHKVTKESIKNVYLMVDMNYKRALTLGHWRESDAIVYPHHAACPYSRKPIVARPKNPKREKEVLAKLDEWIKYAITRHAVGGFDKVYACGGHSMGSFLQTVVNGAWNGSKPSDAILKNLSNEQGWWKKKLMESCRDHIEYPYLNVERG